MFKVDNKYIHTYTSWLNSSKRWSLVINHTNWIIWMIEGTWWETYTSQGTHWRGPWCPVPPGWSLSPRAWASSWPPPWCPEHQNTTVPSSSTSWSAWKRIVTYKLLIFTLVANCQSLLSSSLVFHLQHIDKVLMFDHNFQSFFLNKSTTFGSKL